MTVFKAFLKILRKNLAMIIVYTMILVIFGGLSTQGQSETLSFTAVKPDILIVNKKKRKASSAPFSSAVRDEEGSLNRRA